MKSYYNQEKISSSLRIFFQKIFFLSIPHLKSLSYIITGMISSESVVTSDISRKLKDDFSLFHVKHSDNKVHISFDHMFCKNKFTILLFSLRIGKQGIPLWFRCFKGKHNPDAYNLNLIKDEFDYIIIDNSPFKSYLTSCAMCASDKIITPICVDNFSYDGLMSLLDTIEELNDKYALSIEFAGIFMTRVAGRTTLFRQMYESYENMFGDRFLPISIRNCIAVNESNTTFEPLLTYDKKCPASLDYVELVNYLGLMDTQHYRKLAKYLKGEK